MYLEAFYCFHISFGYVDARIMDGNLKPLKGQFKRSLHGGAWGAVL